MANTDVVADGLAVTFVVMPSNTHKNMLKNMKMADEAEPGSTYNITVLLKDAQRIFPGNRFPRSGMLDQFVAKRIMHSAPQEK